MLLQLEPRASLRSVLTAFTHPPFTPSTLPISPDASRPPLAFQGVSGRSNPSPGPASNE